MDASSLSCLHAGELYMDPQESLWQAFNVPKKTLEYGPRLNAQFTFNLMEIQCILFEITMYLRVGTLEKAGSKC